MKCLLYLACRPEAIKGAASISLADWERATGQARNTVIMALRALEDAGYLRTERAKADNGRNEISLYRLAL
jgi:DNA-binding MarR family transcriptional regulator